MPGLAHLAQMFGFVEKSPKHELKENTREPKTCFHYPPSIGTFLQGHDGVPPSPSRSQNWRAARPELSLGQSNHGLRGGACQLAPALKVIEALVLRNNLETWSPYFCIFIFFILYSYLQLTLTGVVARQLGVILLAFFNHKPLGYGSLKSVYCYKSKSKR
ncbi:Uncharacterized protein HZ326_16219 [Fusarium oxysporum f. sp. albedinis]|nr:Uncharacterized protein HZ326_16219 [Fusarium oxysporum f. sp. albedinis]